MDCRYITEEEFKECAGRAAEEGAIYYGSGGVCFSAVRKGNAARVHVACKRENMRNLRKGCKAFISRIFDEYQWCEMIIATVSVGTPSVVNLCHKLGFKSAGIHQFQDGLANVMVIKLWDL